MDTWLKAKHQADRLISKLTLEEHPHWSEADRVKGFKSYDVKLKGKVIGRVENVNEHIYRKAGRIITSSHYRKAWHYSAPELSTAGMYYTSRKRAVYELVCHLALRAKL